MDNKLIPTNGIWYKIKKFFKSIFSKEKRYNNQKLSYEGEQINCNFENTNNLQTKFEKEKENQELAERLLVGELGTSELNETEVEEMTEYFIKDIQNINNELIIIKQHILAIKRELEQ